MPANKISRRALLKASGALAVLAASGVSIWAGFFRKQAIKGELLGASAKAGHMLRFGTFPTPAREINVPILVVGGGIAGLSAAHTLHEDGARDFLVLDLESEVGGNSRGGQSKVSAYPWGAHYVPVQSLQSKEVIHFMKKFGVIEGEDREGKPIYNETYLCSDPEERLLMFGKWQNGLVPNRGITTSDEKQIAGFLELMEIYRKARGTDGKKAFDIPIDQSSRDPEFTKLDQVTFAEFLRTNGFDSEPLHWYANYCCRDDYGMTHEQTSAWAGIHYFASRDGVAANADPHDVLTWPEGNHWWVKKLSEPFEAKIHSQQVVYNVETNAESVFVDAFDLKTNESVRYKASAVIMALPTFITARVLKSGNEAQKAYLSQLSYSPWMTANIILSAKPEGPGAPLSWDNVSYHSDSLGYVVANHQSLKSVERKTVVTYYKPLTELDPKLERERAQTKSLEAWQNEIVEDLEKMHKGIASTIENIDVWLWGHAMARPTPGLITSEARINAQKSTGRISFAHSDLSALSIFEEALTHGVRAAREAYRWVRPGKGFSG